MALWAGKEKCESMKFNHVEGVGESGEKMKIRMNFWLGGWWWREEAAKKISFFKQ